MISRSEYGKVLRMRYRRLFSLAAFPLLCATAGAAERTFELTPCRLEASVGVGVTNANCGWLEVPENRADPTSRRIRLHVAVVPALSLEPAADPLVFIAGGPGQAPSEEYSSVAGAFERIRRQRDILLLDQRGTGRSNRLQCRYSEETEVASADRARWQAETRRCLTTLAADPRYYTTSVAVRDLEEVRAALGYPQLNLWGGSYGTRVAQHYLRRYPERVRTIILDGVVPPELIIGPAVPLDAERALDAILARCEREPACQAAFPAVRADFKTLRERLRESRLVEFADPVTAEPRQMSFGVAQLAGVVRLLSYSDETAALLPYLIHQGTRDLRPLAAQFSLFVNPLSERLANGMQNAVLCTEDVPYMPTNAAAEVADSYLGREMLAATRAICSVWPRGVMDEDFHAPLSSRVPALLISGENDPVTPPAYGVQALAGFEQGRHLVVSGQGHIVSGTGCMPLLLARFVITGDAAALDASCLDSVRAAPFLLSATASAP